MSVSCAVAGVFTQIFVFTLCEKMLFTFSTLRQNFLKELYFFSFFFSRILRPSANLSPTLVHQSVIVSFLPFDSLVLGCPPPNSKINPTEAYSYIWIYQLFCLWAFIFLLFCIAFFTSYSMAFWFCSWEAGTLSLSLLFFSVSRYTPPPISLLIYSLWKPTLPFPFSCLAIGQSVI